MDSNCDLNIANELDKSYYDGRVFKPDMYTYIVIIKFSYIYFTQ